MDLIRFVYTSGTAVKFTLETICNLIASSIGNSACVNFYAFEYDLYFQYRSMVHVILLIH